MANPGIVALAAKAIKGDANSFEELCRAKQQQMIFSAYTILKNYHDAEDAAQNAIISMYRNITKLKSPEAIDAWIYTIVKSQCAMILRKVGKTSEVDIDDDAIIVEEENREFLPEKYAEDEELSDKVYEIVSTLPEKRREAILMYYYDDLSYKEIAKITGNSIKTVSSNISKARAMIKEKLNLNSKSDLGMLSVGGGSTVMSRIFEQQATKHVSSESLNAFEKTWTSSIKTMKYPVTKSRHILKAVTAVAVTGAVFVGAVVFAHGGGTDVIANQPPPVAAVADSEILNDREIIFAGGDCECGHVNPSSGQISNSEAGDSEAVWKIRTVDSEKALYTESGTTPNKILTTIEKENKTGKYTLEATLTNKAGYIITIERNFEIGTPEPNAE
jgi:RNA polymerase sigma-70 factor (ECF subfamily)